MFMKLRPIFLALALLLSAATLRAQPATESGALSLATPTSGTLTGTYADYVRPAVRYHIIKLAWTSTTGGKVSCTLPPFYGTLRRWAFVPGTGTDAPTDLYDVTIADTFTGLDILGGGGANLSSTTNSWGWTAANDSSGNVMPLFVCGGSTLTILNAGSANTGQIELVFQQ